MTNPQVLIQFADDTTRRIEVAPDQTVLQAALDAGLQLFHQCKTGSCGSCVGTVENGVVRMRSDTSIALLPREIEQRKVLTCRRSQKMMRISAWTTGSMSYSGIDPSASALGSKTFIGSMTRWLS